MQNETQTNEILSGDLKVLKEIRMKYTKNVVIGHININSLANKFEALKFIIKDVLDILVVVETKIDESFPEQQFIIEGFSRPYRLDRNSQGGGVMIYIREDIPSKLLNRHNFTLPMEALFIEINLRKSKLLLIGSYHSKHPKYGTTDIEYFEQISLALDVYSNYDKFLLAGDFNIQEEKRCLKEFLDENTAVNMVKENTCFKSKDNPSCIDLLITNSSKSFQKTTTVSTGLSDFHKMSVTVMKTTFEKQKPKIVVYRDFSKYARESCFLELKNDLTKMSVKEYASFESIFLKVLDKHAPQKKKVLRANHKPYVTKDLRRAIMKRSFLENKYYKNMTEENKKAYKKQKNFCDRLSRKKKSEYYSNLDTKNITDNKKFWKTVKPLFTDKGGAKENITLVHDRKIISNDTQVAQTFNDYFDIAVSSLNITENQFLLTDTTGVTDPVEVALRKFKFHPSILKIKSNVSFESRFKFSNVTAKDIKFEIKNLKTDKANTFINIPVNILKDAVDIVCEPLMNIWNDEIVRGKKFAII